MDEGLGCHVANYGDISDLKVELLGNDPRRNNLSATMQAFAKGLAVCSPLIFTDLVLMCNVRS